MSEHVYVLNLLLDQLELNQIEFFRALGRIWLLCGTLGNVTLNSLPEAFVIGIGNAN